MARSLKVKPEYIQQVKQAVTRNKFARQQDLANDLGLALSTISNFLNGREVSSEIFLEICRKLGLDSQQIGDFEVEEISVDIKAIESTCYQTIMQSGALLRIKSSRRETKTALIGKILDYASGQSYKTANLSLLLADRTVLMGTEEFLRWFCHVISRELRLPDQLDQRWQVGLGSSYNCHLYFDEYLLTELNVPLVLALNDIDRIFAFPEIADDFLSLLRAWHEEAKIREIWQNLRLVLTYSTEDYPRLDINKSTFNVGIRIDLGNG